MPLVEVDPTPHPIPANLLDLQARDSEKLAVVSAGRGAGTLFRHKPLLRMIVPELTLVWAGRHGHIGPGPSREKQTLSLPIGRETYRDAALPSGLPAS
jgi:hypothetical protein